MAERIEFVRRESVDLKTNKRSDEIIVLRDGTEVAMLPEADRLDRALALSLEEVKWISSNFEEIMQREPTLNEQEFWKAVVDHKLYIRVQLGEDALLNNLSD